MKEDILKHYFLPQSDVYIKDPSKGALIYTSLEGANAFEKALMAMNKEVEKRADPIKKRRKSPLL